MGIPAALIKDILDRAHALQEQLIKSGQVTPDLKRSEANALIETVGSRLTIGDTEGALAAAEQARQILTDLLARNPEQHGLSARAIGRRRQGRRRAGGAGRPGGGRSTSYQATASPSESVWRSPILAMPAGSAIWRCRTRRSATCRWRRASLPTRSPPIRRASPSPSAWRSPIPAMPAGSAICRCRTTKIGDVQVAQGKLAGRAYLLSGEPRHRRAPGEVRSRQCRLAARSVGVVREGRRRAGGAGQARRTRSTSYQANLAIKRALGEVRSRQCRLATRSVGVIREGRRRAGSAGQACRTR